VKFKILLIGIMKKPFPEESSKLKEDEILLFILYWLNYY
jgi:hypothetical protein